MRTGSLSSWSCMNATPTWSAVASERCTTSRAYASASCEALSRACLSARYSATTTGVATAISAAANVSRVAQLLVYDCRLSLYETSGSRPYT